MFKELHEETAVNIQKKSKNYSWYLKPETAVFALYSNKLNREEKIDLANKLITYDKPAKSRIRLWLRF